VKRASAALVWLACAACGDGAEADPALDSMLRVPGAQFKRGEPPPDQGGPSVAALELPTNTIWPGLAGRAVRGALSPEATAVLLRLRGDPGDWVVVAGAPDVATPELPSFADTLEFSSKLLPGGYTLEARGVDASGRAGAPRTLSLTALATSPSNAPPAGALVVTLEWDSDADLDLHVLDPLGNEIFHGEKSSRSEFDQSLPEEMSFGVLDADSNANCRIDGRRRESVVWTSSPPSGAYLVRVDATSLCDEFVAHWVVNVLLEGALLGSASGVALDSDTWGPHDRGAGLSALGFEVP
jgi:hypothetical protein